MKRVDAALLAAEVMVGALEATTPLEAAERARVELEVLSREDLLQVARSLVAEVCFAYGLGAAAKPAMHKAVTGRRMVLMFEGENL